jgi:lipopolysaccharide transport system permease protein
VSRYRLLLRELVARDLRVRYAGSAFGFLWAFVNPLWQLALYSVVFSLILRTPLVGEGTSSFPAFLFAGLLPWMAFSEAVVRGTSSIVDNAHLVKKVRFPSETVVVSVAVSALVHAGLALGLFVALRLATDGVHWPALPVMLAGLAGQFAVTLGLALLLATACVFVRDVAHGMQLVISALFYLTPILYPVALVPARFAWAVDANPLSTVVASYRAFLLGSRAPDGAALALLALWGAALLVSGWAVFRRLAGSFADEL